MTIKKTITYAAIRKAGHIKKSEKRITRRLFTWGDVKQEGTMNDVPGQEVMRFVAKSAASRLSIDQHDGRARETVELQITGNRIVGNSPDGSRVIMSIKSHEAVFRKSDSVGPILGYLSDKVEGVWRPELWATIDLLREIRDTFRHWQNNKIDDILISIALSRDPQGMAGVSQNIVRGFRISVPEVAE
jgi:hypothetical protein